jgi:RimJ/RimL family protein N-acetyltransferase
VSNPVSNAAPDPGPDSPTPHPPIELGPITLRAFTEADFEAFFDYRCQPGVARYVRWRGGDHDETVDGLRKRIASCAIAAPGDVYSPAIIETATGRLIGEVMLAWADGEHRQGEVGFGLHPQFQRRGLATMAAAEMLRLGFAEVGLHRIHGGCDPRNGPSAAVMTRLGMREEGILREVEYLKDEWCDEQVFALLATEWRAASDRPDQPARPDRA